MTEIETKTERLTKMLTDEKFGGVLLNAQHNFAWLSGKSNAINLSIENGACFLFVRRDGKKFILANNIEMTRVLTEEISAADFEPIEFAWQTEKASGDFIFETAKTLSNETGEIVSDLSITPKIRAIEGKIAPLRFSLVMAEIERYRSLGKDAGTAIGKVFERIETGETEIEIARKVKDTLAAFDIQSVVTLVGADERIEKFRHPIPTVNVWKKVLLIAVCARRGGLIANLSRIACVGEIPSSLKCKTESVAKVFARMISATTIGKSGAEIYKTTAEAYTEEGFESEIDKHHQGGATGYKTRDWVAHPACADTVFPNQAFAWNPTITGTKAEETIIGTEILTTSPDFPMISVEIEGIEYRSPDILKL
ncbi:MAG TPA: M24 family metallopeptidase [Pyrinomonadaceae bacterium]|mgnify:CR=1 FL=1|nr:M24 family metallopeptidase [Pyrinomonadaceae bacterium]